MQESVDEIKRKLNGKRLLILGGGLWKDAIQKIAEEYNIILIATGNDHSSDIFQIAEEKYCVNSTDHDEMKRLIADKKIDGVYLGGNERVISSACVYLSELKLSCYCTKEQWDNMQDKRKFKRLCIKHGLPVVEQIQIDEQNINESIVYPVITKPTDGCGSSGFSVCHDKKELEEGFKKAKENSLAGKVIVERFVDNDSVVVFYTVSNGSIRFSGLEDKHSVKYEKQGSYVGGLFVFGSNLTSEFRLKFEDKIAVMISDIGLREGTFWIEVFYDGKNYFFNEAGYRYGGSVSPYPINYMYGINQVAIDIYYALTGQSRVDGFISIIPNKVPAKKQYAVYPIYSRAGLIKDIRGMDEIQDCSQIVAILQKKKIGDSVLESGTFSQVIALVHLVFSDKSELMTLIDWIHYKLKIIDQNGEDMICRMFDPIKAKLNIGEKKHSQEFLYLSKTDVHEIAGNNYQLAINAVRDALLMMDKGTTIQPEKSSQVFDVFYQNRINCMTSTIREAQTCGMKWVSVFPSNSEKGIANIEGFVLLSEIITGRLKCMMNATEMTSLRTAAVGALAAKHLARKDAKTVGLIGAGEEARAHFKLIKHMINGIDKCYISSRTEGRILEFIKELEADFPDVDFMNCSNHYKRAVMDADIIVTAISSQEKVLKANWIKTGALYIHVAGLEDEFDVAKKATKIICDCWNSVKHRSQTIVQMYQAGEIAEEDIYADLVEIITGRKAGREDEREFIYFNSVGLSVEDVLLCNRIYEKAVACGKGVWIEK